MTYIVFFARGTLLVVFIAAVVGKLHSRAAWTSFVAATGVLLGTNRIQYVWALLAGVAEFCVAVCLLFNRTAYIGLLLSCAVLVVFLAVIVAGVTRGLTTACNCFGSDGSTIGWEHVWRNLLLVGVAAVGAGAAATSRVPSVFAGARYATPVVLSVTVAALLVMWDDVTYLVVGPKS